MLQRLQTEINSINAEIDATRDEDRRNVLAMHRNQVVNVRNQLVGSLNRAESLLAREPPDPTLLNRWVKDWLLPGGRIHASEVKLLLRNAGIAFTNRQLVAALEGGESTPAIRRSTAVQRPHSKEA
jgi:hypothetical protein